MKEAEIRSRIIITHAAVDTGHTPPGAAYSFNPECRYFMYQGPPVNRLSKQHSSN